MIAARRLALVTVVVVVAVGGVVTVGAGVAPGSTRQVPRAGAVVVRGTARLDGHAFDARWIGAVVRRHGLVTPCQVTLPRVRGGRFAVPVFLRRASAGCGGAGSEVLLWTFRDRQLFADRWIPWGRVAHPVRVRFTASAPTGAVPPRTEISGRAFGTDGRPVPIGTRITARVGTTTCGIASVRAGGGFRGYILNIVGPESISTCAAGAVITFLVGDARASQTAVNGQSRRGLLRLDALPPSAT